MEDDIAHRYDISGASSVYQLDSLKSGPRSNQQGDSDEPGH